jgi:hypothetical protein
MKMQKTILAFVVALLFGVPGLWAQTQTGQGSTDSSGGAAPVQDRGAYPAARGVSAPDVDEPYAVPQTQPDTHALSGAESFSVGSLGGARDIIGVSLFANEYGSTWAGSGTTQTTGAMTTLGGNLNLNRTWNKSRFTAYYNGAASLGYAGSNGANQNRYWYQDLRAEQVVNVGRWALTVHNDFLASPESGFGGQALGGPGLLGQFSPVSAVPLGVLNPGLSSSGSILTGPSMRIINTAMGEADYSLSRRTAITFSGSYGLLHFMSPGYVDSHQITGQLGYDYSLSPESTVALIAGYSRIRFIGSAAALDTSSFQVAYGRKITGRMALQIEGGPMNFRVRDPYSGAGSNLSWTAHGVLTYQFRRIGYSLSYDHNVTAGSGVFFGSKSHDFTASAHRNLTRFWLADANVGYAINDSLEPATSTATGFHNWYAGANLTRQIGRSLGLSINYGIQRQRGFGGSGCPVASCGNTSLGQTFGVTFTWQLRPILVD